MEATIAISNDSEVESVNMTTCFHELYEMTLPLVMQFWEFTDGWEEDVYFDSGDEEEMVALLSIIEDLREVGVLTHGFDTGNEEHAREGRGVNEMHAILTTIPLIRVELPLGGEREYCMIDVIDQALRALSFAYELEVITANINDIFCGGYLQALHQQFFENL
jgi:hypothetical protein